MSLIFDSGHGMLMPAGLDICHVYRSGLSLKDKKLSVMVFQDTQQEGWKTEGNTNIDCTNDILQKMSSLFRESSVTCHCPPQLESLSKKRSWLGIHQPQSLSWGCLKSRRKWHVQSLRSCSGQDSDRKLTIPIHVKKQVKLIYKGQSTPSKPT